MTHSVTISILLLTSIAAVVAIPQFLHCCPPELGTFQYSGRNKTVCRHNDTDNPLTLTCSPSSYSVFFEEDLNLTVTDSGKVFYVGPLSLQYEEFKRGEVCFGYETLSEYDEVMQITVLCTVEVEDEVILGYCMLVSAMFFLLTAVVYASIPEVRDLQGKSMVNFCTSMGIGIAILSATKLMSYSDMTLCAVRGFLIYFFVVAGFFWTNAISLQTLLISRRPLVNNYSWKVFSWYALYAWGSAAVLTLCVAAVNYLPGDHRRPGIGLNTCWFYDNAQQWLYMYSVMAILIIANMAIFIYTSVQLCHLSFPSNHKKALKYKFLMSLRMVITMGLTWIFEIIGTFTPKMNIWYIIDIYNALQGLLIFLFLVVLRKRVLKALVKRGCFLCITGPVEKYLVGKEDDEEEALKQTVQDPTNTMLLTTGI